MKCTDGNESSGVWVFGELQGGVLAPVALELLGAARGLADRRGSRVTAVLIGMDLATPAAAAGAAGADQVILVESALLRDFDDERYATVLTRLIRRYVPEIVLGGATAVGRALLPRVAVQVHTGLTADCTKLEIDPATGLLLQTRPAFGGNILATITCAVCRPQMATVRPGVLPRPESVSGRMAEILRIPPVPEDLSSRLRWVDFRARASGGVDLRSAEVIVTVGYGAGGPDGVRLVTDLAHALGGVLGASRAVVDAGWADYVHQVGQTGTTVSPKIYIACGVSGAIQHIVGMQNSSMIVAINRDPEAPIFAYADLAITGDLREIIPAILQELQENAIAG